MWKRKSLWAKQVARYASALSTTYVTAPNILIKWTELRKNGIVDNVSYHFECLQETRLYAKHETI